ncbi:DUF4393 domain-containing protein [Aeromonas dhakensis]|uniref:DUF4393 domain-containing protein n=1 Tax=Aeromonas dhakensis TaxID=196024 RepID=UPI001116AC05|nr:DUF4393 domain-containing protein [Aeromonas dhakensis]TNI32851.1 hypothetical protein CF131_10565 [Aeromonas dhakensis]
MSDENKIRDTADAIKGIVEAIPVYQDILQPAAKEIGTALQTVAKTVHIALAPVSALVWGYDQIKEFVSTRITEKLKDVPPENIISPKLNVAGPALELLKYTGHDKFLREMYANLVAASMNVITTNEAHPAFVDIIKQLTPDEARILKLFTTQSTFPLLDVNKLVTVHGHSGTGHIRMLHNFSLIGIKANCERPNDAPIYIDNLCRLGLAEVLSGIKLFSSELYEELESSDEINQIKLTHRETSPDSIQIVRGGIKLTEFGSRFCKICIGQDLISS